MSLILNIDTAIDIGYISLARNGEVIEEILNKEQKDHAAFLQPAIKVLLKNASVGIGELDAIAVSAGPGSYTGLRVGMASAKGLCYALSKPLIVVGTLEILAFAAISQIPAPAGAASLFCPMIDARRMEVFTALYDSHLQTVLQPAAMILDEKTLANFLLKNKIYFFGNGATKWEKICRNENAVFISIPINSLAMNKLGYTKYENQDYANLAYVEPFYLKEFFAGNAG